MDYNLNHHPDLRLLVFFKLFKKEYSKKKNILKANILKKNLHELNEQ